MGLSVITIQDEPDGSISLGFVTDPVVESDQQGLTHAQILGLTVFHDLRIALEADLDTGDSEPQPSDSSSI